MTDQIILNADLRERTGSNKARVIRKVDGMIPAIVTVMKKKLSI
jgi:large subunit ribosomal protein L25